MRLSKRDRVVEPTVYMHMLVLRLNKEEAKDATWGDHQRKSVDQLTEGGALC